MLNPLDSIYKTSSQTISGVVLLHSDITVCDCSEDDRPPKRREGLGIQKDILSQGATKNRALVCVSYQQSLLK